jgi:hypothetical protein
LLSTAAILGSGWHRGGFRPFGWRTALAIGAVNHPSRVRFFSSLSRDALPGASKQYCHCIAVSGHYRCGGSFSLSSGNCQRACEYIWRQPPMKKRLGIVAVLLAVGLLALGWRFYGGARVPGGQRPLVLLTSSNFDQLRAAFNAGSDCVRIVLLLSPT